ncbi:MAG: phenylacetate-CoA oxygenase/reductase subunit PaaK [Sporichthyaceae bacterium]|nr:phenylacetate-CoA oxygenase/reductase subunit PaaK [Sporichthyaceae bacterium]
MSATIPVGAATAPEPTRPPLVPSPRRHAVFHPLRVAAVDRLTEDAVAVTFEVPPELAGEYDFVHGQHLTIRTQLDGDEIRRNYSICSPAGSGVLRVAVKALPGGVFSAWVNETLAVGDVVDVMTPTGRFTTPLVPKQAKHYVAVVAGSGITPVLSIASTILAHEPDSRVTLLYGNRSTSSIMFLEELADLKNRYPERFALFHVLSREPVDADLLHGRLDPEKLSLFLDMLLPVSDVDEWFLCGPFEMVVASRELLVSRGVDAAHVHSELFHVEGSAPRAIVEPVDGEPAPDAGPVSTVTVVLDGRSTTFPLPEGGVPVLDAALRARGDAPYACKGGVCGTCRAKLVEGTVRMERNYALEADEVAAGYVLTCQSHPTSEKVLLDYDG